MTATMIELRRSTGAMRCLECGKCSTLCPLSAFGDFSVARMAAIHDPVTELLAHARTIDRCLTCGSCEIRCPQGVRFTSYVRGLRELIPANLRAPCPHGTAMQAAARVSRGRDLSWLTDDLRVAQEGEVAVFVGCNSVFDAMFDRELGIHTIEIARAAIRLLNAAGIEPVIAADERCCGHDLLWDGDPATFRMLAAANAKAFQARGVKHIVTACAECAATWKIDYAAAVPEYKPKVEHIVEFLARQAEGGERRRGKEEEEPLTPALSPYRGEGEKMRVTFQDPCRLARHLNVVDAPRKVLAHLGADVLEMEQHGADAKCCGTAGFIHCDADSRRMQQERLQSAAATGAETLVTACPKCWIHFACAQSEERRRGSDPAIDIEDVTLLAARRLERGEAS